jgi:hypothetical protein
LTANARPGRPLRIRLSHDDQEATANGIYGIVVGAAVVGASHAERATAVIVSVLVTLVVYWAAERYARIVAERIHAGHRPAWHTVRRQLTTGLELLSASFLPLVVLGAVRLVGFSLITAEIASLLCSTVLLGAAGWRIGGRGRLRTGERLVSTAVAAAFGAAMIALKAFLH